MHNWFQMNHASHPYFSIFILMQNKSEKHYATSKLNMANNNKQLTT